MIVLDHPSIRSAERTGYPARSHQRLCPWCGEDVGEKTYNIEGDDICPECFAEWVQDYLSTNPDELAAALCVSVKYEG